MDNSTNFFGEGLWGVIIFLIVAGVFTGNGIFGNRGTDQVTNDFLFNNLANQNRDIMSGISGVDRDVLTTSCNTDKSILESRYTTQLGFQNLGSQMAECCCSIKTEMANNTQKILDTINNNTIQDLRDRINERDRELQSAQFQISQVAQTSSIVDQIRPCPIPAYLTCSPYYSYNYNNGYCGCANV